MWYNIRVATTNATILTIRGSMTMYANEIAIIMHGSGGCGAAVQLNRAAQGIAQAKITANFAEELGLHTRNMTT